MKRPLVLVIAVMVMLAGGSLLPSHAQPPGNDATPTFYHLVPGTYVNGWPRFIIHYPKDWVEVRPSPWEAFRVAAPGSAKETTLAAGMGYFPQPLDKWADMCVNSSKTRAQEVTLTSDKPSQLHDGTPAQEVEVHMVMNGTPHVFFSVATKKGDLAVAAVVESSGGKMEDDLKALAYTLQFQPGFDDPVKVPPDFQEFMDKSSQDYVSHDLAKYMTHFSDAYLNSGVRKGEMERYLRQYIGFATSAKGVITEFVPAGDKVHCAGFSVINGTMKVPAQGTAIKENGEWKHYGNQRDPPPASW